MYKQAAASRIYFFYVHVLSGDVWLAVRLLLVIAVSELASLKGQNETKIGNVCLGACPCPLPMQQKDFRFHLLCGAFSPVTSNVVLHT